MVCTHQPAHRRGVLKFTPEMMLVVKQMWADDHSTQDIMHELIRRFPGYPDKITRNVVIGVIGRARGMEQFKGWFPGRERAGGRPRVSRSRARNAETEDRHTVRSLSAVTAKTPEQLGLERAARDRLREADRERRERRKKVQEVSTMSGREHQHGAPPLPLDEVFRDVFSVKDGDKPKTMFELAERGECKWPIEVDGQTFYCGRSCDLKVSYCAVHRRDSASTNQNAMRHTLREAPASRTRDPWRKRGRYA